MGLSEQQLEELRKELELCKNPLFLFDDDPDGLSSFLLFYRYKGEGHGIIAKTRPDVSELFAAKAVEYEADKVFILDKPQVSQDFLDKVHVPVVWLDHHQPQQRQRVKYYNPRLHDDGVNISTSYWCYQVTQKNLWIAMVGVVGDWNLPAAMADEFRKTYPDLLPESVKTPQEALFGTPVGQLVRIFSFILKGNHQESKKCILELAKISSPYELLDPKSKGAVYIHKKCTKEAKEYDELLGRALASQVKDGLVLFIYDAGNTSFTGDLSNELLYRFGDAVIVIAREKDGDMRCSLRSPPTIRLDLALEHALHGVKGYGGGHEHACGASVKKEDFERFLISLQTFIKKPSS